MPLYRIRRRRPVTVTETHFVNADSAEQACAYIDQGLAGEASQVEETIGTHEKSRHAGEADVEDLLGRNCTIHNARTGEIQLT